MIIKSDLEQAGSQATVYYLGDPVVIELIQVYQAADGCIRDGSTTNTLSRERLYWTLGEAVAVARIRLAAEMREEEKRMNQAQSRLSDANKILEVLNRPEHEIWEAYRQLQGETQ